MSISRGRIAAAALFVCLCAFAQDRKVPSQNQHERVIALVPFVGAGTMEDPRRPMFAPLPGQVDAGSQTGIIAFHFVPTDDGQFAIVELIARNRAAFKDILANTNPAILVFLKGRDLTASIEQAMQQHKKGFTLQSFGQVVVP
jgi:hypothetical protein